MHAPAAASNAPTSALLLRASVDRVVAGGRVVLASIAFVATALEAANVAAARVATLVLLGTYLVAAIVQLGLVMRTLRPRRTLGRIEVVFDAMFAGAATLLTGGQSATVFSFFAFFILANGLRRTPRLALLGGVAYFGIFVATTATWSAVTGNALDVDQLVIRSLLLALSTGALTIFAVERDRLFGTLTSMASWPVTEWPDRDAAMFGLLGAAADLTRSARVALVWSDNEEPWINVALLDDELTVTQLSPGESEALQHIAADDSFIWTRPESDSVVTRITADGLNTSRGTPLSSEVLHALTPMPRSIVGVPAQGQMFSGHLLLLDLEKIPSDFVLRAEIVARQIASSLDIWLLSHRARDLAAREERARVWRDLHDGVVQSLTGLALMLARAEQAIEIDPAEAHRILREAASLVHDEQRDLRLSILEQKAAASSAAMPEDLPTLLADLAHRFGQVWGLCVEVHVDPGLVLTAALSLQVARMIQEALSNSARHGQSKRAIVRVLEIENGLRVTIEDNGRGFPFVGTFSHNTLLERRIGPILLKDRVQRLQGTLDIRSAPTGVELDIRIPLRAARLAG